MAITQGTYGQVFALTLEGTGLYGGDLSVKTVMHREEATKLYHQLGEALMIQWRDHEAA